MGQTEIVRTDFQPKKSSMACRTCVVVGSVLMIVIFLLVAVLLCVYFLVIVPELDCKHEVHDRPVSPKKAIENSEFGYTEVRTGVNLFWWFYYAKPRTDYKNKPLIIWVQGGPGESGCGVGNFFEFGPYDENLMERKTSWVKYANILYIDSPVGSGYSYATDKNLYVTTTELLVSDLLKVVTNFLKVTKPEFQTIPVYVFGESYGGKIGPLLVKSMHQMIKNNTLKCNLVGVALGGPAVHIPDFTSTYGDYLYSLCLFDERQRTEFEKIFTVFNDTFSGVTNGNYTQAIQDMDKIFNYIVTEIPHFDTYHALHWNRRRLGNRTLVDLMNGPMKRELKIIPKDKFWVEENMEVQAKEWPNVLAPVVDVIDYILKDAKLNLTLYNGQLDLIVNAIGANVWMKKLTWPGMTQYWTAPRNQISSPRSGNPVAYKQTHDLLTFYWILDAGHQVPRDNGEASEIMVKQILGIK
ncbi:retinoid-inducible serine carboxypeptidase-like [Tubulanus polymorphus]|uniref:retinoid-inducible serine carboxypeptidase-like n=1 Tax=Tubulanus polymorphus TaxID=672921 RepID=UPI003DA5AA24